MYANRRNFRVVKEIGVEERDGYHLPIQFQTYTMQTRSSVFSMYPKRQKFSGISGPYVSQ